MPVITNKLAFFRPDMEWNAGVVVSKSFLINIILWNKQNINIIKALHKNASETKILLHHYPEGGCHDGKESKGSVLVINSQTLCCLIWCWSQEIFLKYFSIVVLKSHFLVVITQNKKKILVSNRQFWQMQTTILSG